MTPDPLDSLRRWPVPEPGPGFERRVVARVSSAASARAWRRLVMAGYWTGAAVVCALSLPDGSIGARALGVAAALLVSAAAASPIVGATGGLSRLWLKTLR